MSRWRAALAATVVGVLAAALPGHAATGSDGSQPIVPPPIYLPVYPPVFAAGVETPGNMPYFGGQVINHPRIYLDFWGWQGDRDVAGYLTAFFRGVGGSAWLGVVTQYGSVDDAGRQRPITNAGHQLGGVWFDPAHPPHVSLSDADVAKEATRAARRFHVLGVPDVVVLVATPRYANASWFLSGNGCGVHDFADGLALIDLPFVLTAGGSCGENFLNSGAAGRLDGVSMVAGHEYAEAITDPGFGRPGVGAGWRDELGQEIGDKCSWIRRGPGAAADIKLPTGNFAVQSLWSNEADQGLGSCALQR